MQSQANSFCHPANPDHDPSLCYPCIERREKAINTVEIFKNNQQLQDDPSSFLTLSVLTPPTPTSPHVAENTRTLFKPVARYGPVPQSLQEGLGFGYGTVDNGPGLFVGYQTPKNYCYYSDLMPQYVESQSLELNLGQTSDSKGKEHENEKLDLTLKL